MHSRMHYVRMNVFMCVELTVKKGAYRILMGKHEKKTSKTLAYRTG